MGVMIAPLLVGGGCGVLLYMLAFSCVWFGTMGYDGKRPPYPIIHWTCVRNGFIFSSSACLHDTRRWLFFYAATAAVAVRSAEACSSIVVLRYAWSVLGVAAE